MPRLVAYSSGFLCELVLSVSLFNTNLMIDLLLLTCDDEKRYRLNGQLVSKKSRHYVLNSLFIVQVFILFLHE